MFQLFALIDNLFLGIFAFNFQKIIAKYLYSLVFVLNQISAPKIMLNNFFEKW